MAQFAREKKRSRTQHKKVERTTRQPGHQHIEAHIILHRASQTHQTASTTLKYSPKEAARFLEDALRDCPIAHGRHADASSRVPEVAQI